MNFLSDLTGLAVLPDVETLRPSSCRDGRTRRDGRAESLRSTGREFSRRARRRRGRRCRQARSAPSACRTRATASSIFSLSSPCFEPLHCREHVGCQHLVDEEARHVLRDQREFVDRRDEGGALLHFVVARRWPLARPRRVASARTGEKKCRPIRRPGSFSGAAISSSFRDDVLVASTAPGLILVSMSAKSFCLISSRSTMASMMTSARADALAFGIGDQARLGSVACCLGLELPREELALRLDAFLKLLRRNVLQRHLHAGRNADAGDVGAHRSGTDDVHAARPPLEALRCLVLQKLRQAEDAARDCATCLRPSAAQRPSSRQSSWH